MRTTGNRSVPPAGVWAWLLPDADAPGSAGHHAAALPATGLAMAVRGEDLLVRDSSQPLTLRIAVTAWGMLAWAVAYGTNLYEHLARHPATDTEARTAGLALWLLLYDSATTGTEPSEHWMRLDLAEVAACLDPDTEASTAVRAQLRSPAQDALEALTDADTQLLRQCSTADWDRACAWAHLALVVHLEDTRVRRAYAAGYQLEPAFLRPRLLDCHVVSVAG